MIKSHKKFSAQDIANALFERGDWAFKYPRKFSLWQNIDHLREMKLPQERIKELRIIIQFCATKIFAENYNKFEYRDNEETLLVSNFCLAADTTWPNGFRATDENEFDRRLHQAFINSPDFRQKLYDAFLYVLIGNGYKDAEKAQAASAPATDQPRKMFLIKQKHKELAIPTLTQ